MKTKPFDPYEFKKKVIKGVPVYYKQMDFSPSIYIQICFNVGNMHDPKGSLGLSHFLEHMIFDGSPKLPNKKVIQEWSKVHAFNSWNAWTWYTHTTYHLRFLPEKIDTILDGLADMIFNPILRPEDVEHERNVITQEAWGRYKNDKYLKYRKEITKNFFHGTAMEDCDSPLGWPETVAKISREEVAQWHKKNYGRGNFFMVVGGAINDKTLHKIEKFLSGIPAIKKPDHKQIGVIKKPALLNIIKRADEIGDIQEQAEVTIEHILPMRESESEEINLTTASLLGDLLFERLRTERALCYGVHTGAHVQQDYVSWGTTLKIDEKNIEIVKKEFWKAISDITSGKEKARFETTKQMRIDRLRASEEIAADIIYNAVGDVWQYGKIISNKERMRQRMNVSYDDVVRCLKKAFDKKRTVTEIILPSMK